MSCCFTRDMLLHRGDMLLHWGDKLLTGVTSCFTGVTSCFSRDDGCFMATETTSCFMGNQLLYKEINKLFIKD